MKVAARTRVDLPIVVPERFEVYVNGIPQQRGVDYEVDGRALVFERSLASEGRLGFWRWLSIVMGVAGTYRQNDSIDVVYQAAGRRHVLTGLKPEAE
jgi:hypothetical protein